MVSVGSIGIAGSMEDLEPRTGSKGSIATSVSTAADSERPLEPAMRPRSAKCRSRPPKLLPSIQVSKPPTFSPTSSQSTPRNLDLEALPRPGSSTSNYSPGSLSSSSRASSSRTPTPVPGGVGNRSWAAWQSCNIHKDLAFERNLDLCFDPQQSPTYQPSNHPDAPAMLPPGVEPLMHFAQIASKDLQSSIKEDDQAVLSSEVDAGKVLAPRAPSSQRPARTGRSSRAWTKNQLSQLRENFNLDMNPDLCFAPLREGRRPACGLQHCRNLWQSAKN